MANINIPGTKATATYKDACSDNLLPLSSSTVTVPLFFVAVPLLAVAVPLLFVNVLDKRTLLVADIDAVEFVEESSVTLMGDIFKDGVVVTAALPFWSGDAFTTTDNKPKKDFNIVIYKYTNISVSLIRTEHLKLIGYDVLKKPCVF